MEDPLITEFEKLCLAGFLGFFERGGCELKTLTIERAIACASIFASSVLIESINSIKAVSIFEMLIDACS